MLVLEYVIGLFPQPAPEPGFWDAFRADGTLENAFAVGLIGAAVAAISFVIKSIWQAIAKAREERALLNASIIRFQNDVAVWRADWDETYTKDYYDALVDLILRNPDDFRFVTPASDDFDAKEMNKYLHRFEAEEMRTIRRYIVYYELLLSLNNLLSDEVFGTLTKERKIGVLTELFKSGHFLRSLADDTLTILHRYSRIHMGERFRATIRAKMREASDHVSSWREAALLRAQASGATDEPRKGDKKSKKRD